MSWSVSWKSLSMADVWVRYSETFEHETAAAEFRDRLIKQFKSATGEHTQMSRGVRMSRTTGSNTE
jgi:hypothetical protein